MANVRNITDLEGYGPPKKVSVARGVRLSPGKSMTLDSSTLGRDPLVSGLLVVEDGGAIPSDIQALLRTAKADKQLTRLMV